MAREVRWICDWCGVIEAREETVNDLWRDVDGNLLCGACFGARLDALCKIELACRAVARERGGGT